MTIPLPVRVADAEDQRPRVAVIGGGLLGMAAAWRLLQAGVHPVVYERDAQLGGLAGTVSLDGIAVDRYAHLTLPTDERVIALAAEVGLGESFRFRRCRAGLYHQGRATSMCTPRELVSFPGLKAIDRVRLVALAARCRAGSDYLRLDETPLEEWLVRLCGRRPWEQLWRPLLDSKFDGRYHDLPATYLWSRLRRMSCFRDPSSHLVMGALDGGCQALVDALANAIRRRGGDVRANNQVGAIVSSAGRAFGVVSSTGFEQYDHVVSTLLPAATRPLLGPDLVEQVGDDRCRYLGVVSLVLRLRRRLSPWYALSITDRRVPLTAVVETTHVIDPERVGGALVYATKYVNSDSPDLERSTAEVKRAYLGHIRTMFPGFSEAEVLAGHVARRRMAEPVHTLGGGGRPPDMFPAPGLATASSAHVYPETVSGDAAIGVAERLVAGLITRLESTRTQRAAA
ncbi:MAG: FAD-dependent oxidoreductase [Thermoleophilaceae bacterium]|nr:FAD-dependent oxidoreductase [Thermoleophilaceae bacterium]